MFNNFFFKNGAVYEILWKNIVQSDKPLCIPNATNPHSAYVIPIAFPLQKWSQERVSILGYTYTACLVIT